MSSTVKFITICILLVALVAILTVPWLWCVLDDGGRGALVGSIIGFIGLIVVAAWSSRQNSNAIVLSAKEDRNLQDRLVVQKKLENLEFLKGYLSSLRAKLNDVVERYKTEKENGFMNLEGAFRGWDHVVRKGIWDAHLLENEPSIYSGVSAKLTSEIIKFSSDLNVVKNFFLDIVDSAKRQAEAEGNKGAIIIPTEPIHQNLREAARCAGLAKELETRLDLEINEMRIQLDSEK